MNQKLAGWKARQLSRAGRVTLAKSVLQAIPIYPMMAAALPKSIIYEIEKIQRSFVWGDEEGHKKIHAINWGVLTRPKQNGGLGLRNLAHMNTACLLKLAWDLRCNSDSLWCQVLRRKYHRHAVGSKTWIHKPADSSLWRAIAPLEDFLQKHERWSIGNGRSTNLWNQNWLNTEVPISDLVVDIPANMLNMCVADLVTINGTWNYAALENWLPEELLAALHALPVPTNGSADEDKCFWPTSTDGRYTVAAGYNLLCNLDSPSNDNQWKEVWRLETTERVRHFIWLISHDRLLTNERKAKMHLGAAECHHCQNVTETTLHVLRDCPMARNMWLHLLRVDSRPEFFGCTLQHWISMNLQTAMGHHSDIEWSAIWANGCHLLWNWRNRMTHDTSFAMPWKTWLVTLKTATEYHAVLQKQVHHTKSSKITRLIAWSPPSTETFKLNADGASSPEYGLAGCGGLIRDSNGCWIAGFSKSLGYCSAYVAELWGVLEGLQLAKRKGLMHLTVELDAAGIISELNNQKLGRGEGWNVMRKIKDMLINTGWKIQFQHTFKEGNKCAHLLANIGKHQLDDIVVYDVLPMEISKAISDDMIGAATPRLMPV